MGSFTEKIKTLLGRNDFNQQEIKKVSFEYRRPVLGFHAPEAGQLWYVARVWCVNMRARQRIVKMFRTHPEFEKLTLAHEELTPIEEFIMQMLRIDPVTNPCQYSSFHDRKVNHEFATQKWFSIQNIGKKSSFETFYFNSTGIHGSNDRCEFRRGI